MSQLDGADQQEGVKHMFLVGHFIWPCLLPIVALLVALAVPGVRDILFAIDSRSRRKAARGVALLAAPIIALLVCLLVWAASVLQLFQLLSEAP